MKKFNLLILFILSFVFSMNAQITKDSIPTDLSAGDVNVVREFTLNSSTRFGIGTNLDVIVKYFSYKSGNDSQTKIITFYNLDYSIYKTLNISIPSDCTAINGISFATTHLFNSDDLIEFVVSFSTASMGTYILMNENGDVIFDFKNDYPNVVFTDKNGEYKLYATRSGVGYSYPPVIYTLRSTKVNLISDLNIKSSIAPFPNPAKQIIHLPYQLELGSKATMKIFDVNAKQITTKQIDATFDKILLDVSAYQKGMYVYEYNGKSGKFVVE